MKSFLLTLSFLLSVCFLKAQTVSELPAGKYETKTKFTGGKWERGDIILIDESHYKLSNGGEIGDYKFSVAAQRIFFTTGPLKSAFTKLTIANGKPIIIFPPEQNEALGITAEVLASKQ